MKRSKLPKVWKGKPMEINVRSLKKPYVWFWNRSLFLFILQITKNYYHYPQLICARLQYFTHAIINLNFQTSAKTPVTIKFTCLITLHQGSLLQSKNPNPIINFIVTIKINIIDSQGRLSLSYEVKEKYL